MKSFLLTIVILFFLPDIGLSDTFEWQLPIQLGSTRNEVHDILGPPKETLSYESVKSKYPEVAETIKGIHNEYFYSSGLVVRFHNGKVFGITINSHDGGRKGWIVYQGSVVNEVVLSDSYDSSIKKLGQPIKSEEEKIYESGDSLDKPVVLPAVKSCYWRSDMYTIQIDFLMQAGSISEGHIAHRNSISIIFIYK